MPGEARPAFRSKIQFCRIYCSMNAAVDRVELLASETETSRKAGIEVREHGALELGREPKES
jgi:hypothetical protein